MLVRPFVIAILTVLAAACSGDPFEGRVDRFMPPAGPSPDVYRGVFPCDNCIGIESTLWLRGDGTFFWRQQYLGDDGESTATARNLGRWQLDGDGLLVLEGAGPARHFTATSADELRMLTPSTLEHRLFRDLAGTAFTDRIRIEGMAAVDERGARIAECRTGLAARAGGDALRPFLRQYRTLGFRGEAVFVEIEARFEWSADGELRSFAVERILATKPNRTC